MKNYNKIKKCLPSAPPRFQIERTKVFQYRTWGRVMINNTFLSYRTNYCIIWLLLLVCVGRLVIIRCRYNVPRISNVIDQFLVLRTGHFAIQFLFFAVMMVRFAWLLENRPWNAYFIITIFRTFSTNVANSFDFFKILRQSTPCLGHQFTRSFVQCVHNWSIVLSFFLMTFGKSNLITKEIVQQDIEYSQFFTLLFSYNSTTAFINKFLKKYSLGNEKRTENNF